MKMKWKNIGWELKKRLRKKEEAGSEFEAIQRTRVLKPTQDFPPALLEKILNNPEMLKRFWKKGRLTEYV